MNDNDRLQMYEAQAIAIEQQRELEQKEKELEEARREIERLRATTQQIHFMETIAEMKQTFNAKFEDLRLQISNLQQTFDEKTAENLQFQETVAGINRRIEELEGEFRAESEQKTNQKARISDNCSELNLYVSVMLFGGHCNGQTDSICLYNSKKREWINSPLKLPNILACHGSVILNDEIYIFGGFNGGELKSTYKLGENRKWIKLADMNTERQSFGSLVFEDEIWVFGGSTWIAEERRETYLKTVEKYSPQTNTWTLMSEMEQASFSFDVSTINEKFYLSGRYHGAKSLDKIEVFDPKKNKWEFFCNMPCHLNWNTSTVDGTNLIIIGEKQFCNESNEVWKIDVLDPKKEWKKMPSLQQKRRYHNAVKLVDELMVIGGEIGEETETDFILNFTRTDSVEIFDGQKWKEGPKLPEKRSRFSLISLTSKNEKKFLQLLS